MKARQLKIALLWMAALAAASVTAMTTADNASKAPVSKAAAPAKPAKPASGTPTKGAKETERDVSSRAPGAQIKAPK